MLGPVVETVEWIKAHVPSKIRLSSFRPHFNFITIHYTYMICITLIGSIMLYPAGGMAYIDALFFASGAATQSGLNTIDVNKLYLYQQVVIFFIACICNPIFINTVVVFVRLYWFEKRFQRVVQEARNLRRTRTRSRTKSEMKDERDPAQEEQGVGGREIVVLRQPNGQAQGKKIEDDVVPTSPELGSEDGNEPGESADEVAVESDHEEEDKPELPSPFHRDITFADEVKRPNPNHFRTFSNNSQRAPDRRTKEQHIAFVENQRNPKDKGALRIPGPRDFDLGFVPERVDDDAEGRSLGKKISNDLDREQNRRRGSGSHNPREELNSDDHPFKQNITIDEPDHPRRPGTGKSAFRFPRRRDGDAPEPSMSLRQRARSRTFGSMKSSLTQDKDEDPMPYLSWTPTVGRNSAFVDLTEEQREELGGIEYRSLKLLAIILVGYYVGFHLFGMVCLLPWLVKDNKYSTIVREDGVNPVWWGFFTPASMFNDLGFTLTPDSMISFQFTVWPLILGSFLIIIGNTGFPCMLRFVIWGTSLWVPRGSGVWEELRFLLDHPRRCFTLLFPSSATWWLFWILVLLNGIDLVFFIILDIKDPTVVAIPGGFKFLDGLFQAASTRTAGFGVVNVADLHPAIQVSYLIMMYISVFPIAISMRRTNVYEEKSLGVWASEEEDDEKPEQSYLGTHFRRQLSFDLWFVFLGFFLIAIVEGSRLQNTNDYAFTLFSVLFEIVSAYGTVGLSLGYPNVNTSFSAEFRTLSKLIIIGMQIRGRHRGLPYALDRAILLPSESLHKKENEDATRRARRPSIASEGLGNGGLRRSQSNLSGRSGGAGGRRPSVGVGQFFAGALSAGPTFTREKMN